MGSTYVAVPAVTLNGLHVGLPARLHTKWKTGKMAGKEKVKSVDQIIKVEHDGKCVRVYSKHKQPSGYGYYYNEQVSNVLEFDDIVEVWVTDGN